MSNFYLAIESATKVCSVAVFENDQLLHVEESDSEYSHAEKLAPYVDLCLKKCDLSADQLSAVAISSGPGSYTGLRIGLSLAKGICFASGIPLISISTLKAMAHSAYVQVKDDDALYAPMIDARRMEVYTACYNSSLKELESVSAKVIDESSPKEYTKDQRTLIFGDGAAKCEEALEGANIELLEGEYVSTQFWGELIHRKYQDEEFEDLAYYEPLYYKSFKAIKPKSML